MQRWATAVEVRTPQLRNIADNQTDCGLQKLQNCDCGSSKFDFRNSTTLSSFLPILLLSSPRTVLKILDLSKIFLELSVFMENKNLPEKDSSTRLLTSDFFHESTAFLIHTLNYFHIGMSTKKRCQKSHATVPLKSSE
jgi:hypothetical protein